MPQHPAHCQICQGRLRRHRSRHAGPTGDDQSADHRAGRHRRAAAAATAGCDRHVGRTSIARVQPASPTSLFLMGVAPGRTTVIATTDAGQAIVQYDVTVAPVAAAPPARRSRGAAGTITPAIASAIQATIARTVQGASAVRVQGAGTDAILTGTVPNATAAQQAEAIARGYVGEKGGVVDNLTVLGAIQVNVRVRIAEINRSVTRQLGFNWQALGSGNGWRFGLRTGAAVAGTDRPLLPLGLAPLSGATSAPIQLGSGFTSGNKLWDVNAIIDALAGDQLITILAEPNLTALSGETASFLAGGEFPIPIAGNSTNGRPPSPSSSRRSASALRWCRP